MIFDLLSFPSFSPQVSQKSLKMVIFEMVDWEWQTLKKLESDYDLIALQDCLTPDNALHYKDADIISTCVHSELNKFVLQQFPKLKLIVMRSPNYENIDHQYCQDYQISICNVQSYFPLL